MSQDTQRDQLSKKRVVHTVPGMEAVPVRRDEPYRVTDAGPLTMDLYYPPDSKAGARTPAVIFVTGFSDLGAERMLGSRFKDMGSFVSWAQLVAISGLVGITYANREPGDVKHSTSVGPHVLPMRRNSFASSLLPQANRCMICGMTLQRWW